MTITFFLDFGAGVVVVVIIARICNNVHTCSFTCVDYDKGHDFGFGLHEMFLFMIEMITFVCLSKLTAITFNNVMICLLQTQ